MRETAPRVKLPAELRWHGRGGQGVVTASRLLATGGLAAGLYPQSLPDFGAERSGAPIVAYTRFDTRPPMLRGPVTAPAAVAVLDETLIGSVPLLEGMVDGGVLVVNTRRSPESVGEQLDAAGVVICTVDGDGISIRLLGRPLPNSPLLGALVRVFPIVEIDALRTSVREQMQAVFSEKVVEGNLAALSEGYEVCRVGEVR